MINIKLFWSHFKIESGRRLATIWYVAMCVNSCIEFEDSNWNVDRTYNSFLKFSYTKIWKIYHTQKKKIIWGNKFTIFLRHSFMSCLYLAVVLSSHFCVCFLFGGVVFWYLSQMRFHSCRIFQTWIFTLHLKGKPAATVMLPNPSKDCSRGTLRRYGEVTRVNEIRNKA